MTLTSGGTDKRSPTGADPRPTFDAPSLLSQALSLPHLPTLDGLRALSVLVVICYHFGFSRVPGDLGVSTFFVLSGFLITWLLLKEYDHTGRISIRDFYARRTLRIFPAYYAFLLLVFSEESLRGLSWPPGLFLSGFSYTVNYYNAFHGHPGTAIAHAWSLAIEEQFYLVWPAIFMGIAALSPRRKAVVLASMIAAVLAWRSALVLSGAATPAYVYNALDTRLDNLLIGCLLAVCCRLPRFGVTASATARSPLLPVGTLGLLVVSRTCGGAAYHYSVGLTVDAILIAVFIAQSLQLYRTRLWSWLEHPVLRYLGRISYPMYLYHQLGLGIGRHAPLVGVAGEFVVGLAVTIALASGSYYLIERPFLALKRRFEPAGERAK